MQDYPLILDTAQTDIQQTVTGFYCGDRGEKRLSITLLHQSTVYTPQAGTLALCGRKPDGTRFLHPCSASGSQLVYLPTAQTLAVPGTVECQLIVYGQDGSVLFAPRFAIEVAEPMQPQEGLVSADEWTLLPVGTLAALSAPDGSLLYNGSFVGATVLAQTFADLPAGAEGQTAFVCTGDADHPRGFYRFAAQWEYLPTANHTHDNQETVDALRVENGQLYLGNQPVGILAFASNLLLPADVPVRAMAYVSSELSLYCKEQDGWKKIYNGQQMHTHANQSVLDTVTADVVSDSHIHSNKSVLDTVTADVVSDSHAHTNAAVLAQVEAAHLHTHANKTALDTLSLVDGYLYSGQKNLTNLIEVSNVSDLPQGAPLGTFALVNGRSLYRQVNGQVLNGFELFYDRVKQHTHDNKSVLDKFGEADGQPTYDDNQIVAETPDPLVPLALGTTYPSLSVRSNWQDVPVYNTGANEAVAALSDANGDNYLSLMYLVDEVTGMPCPLLQVSVSGVWYNCYGTTYNDVGMVTRQAGWYTLDQMEYIGTTPPTMENISFASLIVYNDGTPTQTEYNTLANLPADAQCALETLSRIFNVSVDAMGGLGTKPDGVQRLTPAPQAGRRYAFATGDDITFPLPQIAWTGEEREFWVDLNCMSSINLTFSDTVDYEDGGNIDTTSGKHRLHFYAPAGATMWTVAETESVSEITEDVLPEYVIPFRNCTADQIRAVLKFGYNDGSGNWCLRRKGGVVQTWFSAGDTHPVTLTDGREVTMRIIGIEHDDLLNGGKAAITCDFVEAVGIPETNVSSGNYRASQYRTAITNLYGLLPEWLKQNVVKAKKVLVYNQTSDQIQDYMWAFSATEFGKTYNNIIEGSAYPYYTDAASRKHRRENGDAVNCFMRTQNSNYNRSTYLSTNDGIGYADSAGVMYAYAVIGFCLNVD